MAMLKQEMILHAESYHTNLQAALAFVRKNNFFQAVNLATKSLPFVDGMMQYEKRYENKTFKTIESIELIFQYAPALLDIQAIKKVQEFLKEYRRIDKNTSTDLSKKSEIAIKMLWQCHKIYTFIEMHPECDETQIPKSISGKAETFNFIIDIWKRSGVVRESKSEGKTALSLATRLGEIVPSKCNSCGTVFDMPKAMCLEPVKCVQCNQTTAFTLI